MPSTAAAIIDESAAAMVKVDADPSTVHCACPTASLLVTRRTKEGRTFHACGNRTQMNGTWMGGCGMFFWGNEWSKVPVCDKHNKAKCGPCFVDPRIQSSLSEGVQCYCDEPARAALSRKEDPPYVFFNCGSKRIKTGPNSFTSRCPFWARADQYYNLANCDGCQRKVAGRGPSCWVCYESKKKMQKTQ